MKCYCVFAFFAFCMGAQQCHGECRLSFEEGLILNVRYMSLGGSGATFAQLDGLGKYGYVTRRVRVLFASITEGPMPHGNWSLL